MKNSLNPDLNTADSQSFVPRFNNVQVDEKQAKAFTDLPLNHWTSSPRATQLWQKALSVCIRLCFSFFIKFYLII